MMSFSTGKSLQIEFEVEHRGLKILKMDFGGEAACEVGSVEHLHGTEKRRLRAAVGDIG
jgi:hypothetical protein